MVNSSYDIIVIDNYDSFTWNIVEYVSAITERSIEVFRNDKISVAELESLHPKLLIISPGPGHPETDAGISADCISAFAGRIPILGVCMGQQCMFTVFGGKVEQTGEILHGKTSLVQHDGRGIYAGVPQNIPVTRYHSLAGTRVSLPDCLEVTCWTEGGVIMGVRHKEYAIEGVQFHPESILSEGGKAMFSNFLKIKSGRWSEQEVAKAPTNGVTKKKTILETIHEQRLLDIASSKATPGTTPEDLLKLLTLNLAPPQIDFIKRVRQNAPEPAVMAEIKRASPSKGDIDITANAASQALLYATGGASVISVLTEPKWFKGSLNDLRAARDAIAHMPNRPALLRKDFIIDRYQIDEARIYGADTILLIVAMLSSKQLEDLYKYAQSLGMEPLVEVNNQEEMQIAVRLGAKVIGVNNRNLHDFAVDMNTTSKLAKGLDSGITLCALSGITGRADVVKYISEGVGAVLVGEALMRSTNKLDFINELLGRTRPSSPSRQTLIVKICGTRTLEGAQAAADAGADMVGLIFVPGRKRTIDISTAQKIVSGVRRREESLSSEQLDESSWFAMQTSTVRAAPRKPLFVGVFQNQSLSEIIHTKLTVPLDIIQLHGDEPDEWCRIIPGPVIKAFGTSDSSISRTGYHAIPLVDATSLDGTKGGSGAQINWTEARHIVDREGIPIMVAGGLTPDNVSEAITSSRAWGVDVSSGVETEGKQDAEKIRRFIHNAKMLADART